MCEDNKTTIIFVAYLMTLPVIQMILGRMIGR
jgi:hypothetical protein